MPNKKAASKQFARSEQPAQSGPPLTEAERAEAEREAQRAEERRQNERANRAK